MAKKVVGREMTSKVALDTAEAVKSLKTLNTEVKASTSSWKAQETALKSAGDYQKATAARVNGLAKSMELQKTKIDELKSRQSGLNRDTKDGEQEYLKLTDQINKATRSYDSMGGQLDRAKSKLQYYNSGLADLQKDYKQSTELSKSYVERLEAEGKTADANKAKLSGMKQAYSNIEAQYKAQTSELNRIKEASGATSDAYKRQQVRVNQTATSMAKLKGETNELDSALHKANATPFTKMLDSAKSKLGLVRKEEDKTKDATKSFAIGSIIGNAVTGMASSAVGYIKSVTAEGYKLAEAGGTIKKQWTNLGLSDADATKMTAQIGDIRSKANLSGGAIDQVQKKFYAMTNSASKARSMTEVLASYGSAAGKSGDQITALSQGIGKLSGSTKVTASLFKRSFSQVPELQKAIVKASGMTDKAFNTALNGGKITGTQLQKYLVSASKTSGKAWSEFGDTTKGKLASLQGTYTNLKVTFAKPLVSGIEKAIDGVSKKKGAIDDVKSSISNLVSKMGEKTGQFVGSAIKFLVKNEKPIESIGGSFASIVGSLSKGAWSLLSDTAKIVSGHSKDASKGLGGMADAMKSISKHQNAVEIVGKGLVTYFAISKLTTIAGTLASVAGGIASIAGFMIANPFTLIIAGIAAVGLGFYEAYKHIKPFRDAVNGVGHVMNKLFTGKYDWEKSIGKKLASVGSTISKWGKGAGKLVSKHKTEILAGLVSPFAGLSAWFLKDTKTGKNVQKWAKGFGKDVQKMGLKDAMNKQIKSAGKAFSKSKFGKWYATMSDSFDDWKKKFSKNWSAHWSSMGKKLKSNWNGAVKNTKGFFSSMGSHFNSFKKSWSHNWDKHWDDMRSSLHSYWNKDLKHTKVFGVSMSKWLDDFKNLFKGGWKNLGKGVSNIFSDMWTGLKHSAQDGINGTLDVINAGISAVNGVIHTFGGKKTTIGDLSHVKLATGTGFFSGTRRAITQPTLAMLNDGNDSPQTGNQETLVHANGDAELIHGKNVMRFIEPGAEVFNATETRMLGLNHFADGTGFFGSIMHSVSSTAGGAVDWVGDKVKGLEKYFKMAQKVIAHPIKSLESVFKWTNGKTKGIMTDIGKGVFDKTSDQVKTWWKALWGGVSSSIDASGAGGSSSSLVNGMEKYGATNKYVYGAEGPSAFDCSGLVEYTLKKMGISFPRTSGEQYKATKHVSNPKPGDLVFFGPGGNEHVGVYTGGGKFYSAENEKDGMGISSVHGGGYGTFAGYGRVPGLSNSTSSDSDKITKSSGLLGTIKKQVGSGFWKFISKLADEFGDGSSESNPGGSGVQRWKPDVIKALKKNGFEATASQVSAWMKVISRESNGDPKVVNHWDANAKAGHPSKGLVQTIQPTFDSYSFKGHKNIFNGYDDLLAGINYMAARYGRSASAFARVSGPEGYENGGIVATNQLIEVAEKNKPEMVLPLTNKSRANQLIKQASQIVNGNSDSKTATKTSKSKSLATSSSDYQQLKKLVSQGEKMITLLMQLLDVNENQVKAIGGIKPLNVDEQYKIQAKRQSLADYQSYS